MRIDLTSRGSELAAEHLRDFAARAEYTEPFFQQVSYLLMEEAEDRFRAGGRPKWTPLDADTIRQKAKKPGSRQLMRQSGLLFRALTIPGAAGQYLSIRQTSLVFGLAQRGLAYYGAFHQHGDGVPQRVLLKKTARTGRRVREALDAHLMSAFGGGSSV